MREIKFRFLMEDGTVTTEYYLKELIDSDKYIDIECEWNSKIKQELQYTGLKDKNGVEIYEGDVVRLGEMHRTKDESNIGQIIWTKYQYAMDGDGFSLLLCNTKDVEVIGNIYENKELLEDK